MNFGSEEEVCAEMRGQADCAPCKEDLSSAPTSVIGQKGLDGLKKAAGIRGDVDTISNLSLGATIHKKCREKFVNQKSIGSSLKNVSQTHELAPKTRSEGPYDIKNGCIVCFVHNLCLVGNRE